MLMMLIVSSTLVMIPAGAQGIIVPGDLDGDKIVSDEEMDAAEQSYKDGKITSEELEEIRHIHENYPRTITDSAGREVTIYKPIDRIVTISEYSAEAVRMFEMQNKIVGIYDTIKTNEIYFPRISELPSVGRAFNPDIEAILNLDPDLVFAWTYKVEELDGKIPESIVVVGLDLYKPETLVGDVEKCGYILEKEDKASHYLDSFYNRYIDLIKDRTEGLSEEERPTVYIEGTFGKGENDYQTFGSESGAQQMIDISGGRNLFTDLSGSMPHVDPEAVIERDPDIIIKYCSKGEGGYDVDDSSKMETLWKSTMNRPALAHVRAVDDGHVYIMDKGPTYGLDYPVAVAYWAKCFHPDLFEDLDPQAIHQEYLTEFQGLDYDLDEHGVFVYPEPGS
ncbi:MAG: ABC transporter substrate-binding protein [Methanotrichaceae archaeon]